LLIDFSACKNNAFFEIYQRQRHHCPALPPHTLLFDRAGFAFAKKRRGGKTIPGMVCVAVKKFFPATLL